MKDKKFHIACDDADPESSCKFPMEGSSLDELYQKMISHGYDAHPDRMNAMSPEDLMRLEKRMTVFIEKEQKKPQPFQRSVDRG